MMNAKSLKLLNIKVIKETDRISCCPIRLLRTEEPIKCLTASFVNLIDPVFALGLFDILYIIDCVLITCTANSLTWTKQRDATATIIANYFNSFGATLLAVRCDWRTNRAQTQSCSWQCRQAATVMAPKRCIAGPHKSIYHILHADGCNMHPPHLHGVSKSKLLYRTVIFI